MRQTGGVDVIIDDGLHDYGAGVSFFEGVKHLLAPTGTYVIEDVYDHQFAPYSEYFERWRDEYQVRYAVLGPHPLLQANGVIIVTPSRGGALRWSITWYGKSEQFLSQPPCMEESTGRRGEREYSNMGARAAWLLRGRVAAAKVLEVTTARVCRVALSTGESVAPRQSGCPFFRADRIGGSDGNLGRSSATFPKSIGNLIRGSAAS